MKHRTAIYVGYVLLICLSSFLLTVNAAPGDLDTTFSGDGKLIQGVGASGFGGFDIGRATAIQPDGKIIAAGEASSGGRRLFAVARYNADGSLDTTFGDGGKKMFSINATSGCDAVALQPDGKIVMVGYSEKGSTNFDFAVARLNADGSLDTTFDGDGMLTTNISSDDQANGVAIQADGSIVVIGISGGTNYTLTLVRYLPDGLLDTSFDGDGKVTTSIGTFGSFGYDVALQADEKIIVGGEADGKMAVIRYNTNGSLDVSFDGDGIALISFLPTSSGSTVVIQPDGKIVAAGKTHETNVSFQFAVARLNTNGSLDTSFDGDGKATYPANNNFEKITESAIQADGKIILAAYLTNGLHNDFVLLRYNADGSLDTTFDGDGRVTTDISNATNEAYGVAIQTDGKIIAAGGNDNDSSIFSDFDFLIVRYNANGSLDTSFDGDGNVMSSIGFFGSTANAVAIQPDGKIVAAGNASYIRQRNGFALVRYNADGSLDTTFDGDGTVITDVLEISSASAVVIQPDGKIVAAGYARTLNSRTDFALVRYNADGSLDTTFDGDGKITTPILGFDDYITDIELQPDGKIVVGGYSHTNDSGNPPKDSVLARYNADGSLDTTFSGDGKLNFQIGTLSEVAEILIQPDGKIVTVGSYRNNNNGSSQFALVRFAANGDGDGSFGIGGVVTTGILNSRDSGEAAALQADGKIVVAGTNSSGFYNLALARYNPNGSLDTSFDGDGKIITDVPGSYESSASVAIQANGKILVAGRGSPGDEFSGDMLLVRYNVNGSLDSSYGNGGHRMVDILGGTFDTGYGVALDSNGRAVVVGEAGGNFAVARILGDAAAPSSDAPFDFDGDGKTDLSIFRPSVGEWWIYKSTNGGNAAFQFGNSSDKIVPGDFTGDGKTDPAIFRHATGEWFILRSEDRSFYSFPFGTAGDIPSVGDFDGDGKADATVFRPANATWYISKSSGGTLIEQFGQNGDVPVVADYDGDGKSDIAIWRASVGQWWIKRSTAGIISFQFGNSSDKPVQGDHTGDGKSDVAIWRPSTGEWFILRSENFSYYLFPFGTNGDLPAPGDYDGDGRIDAAVFRSSSSTWYIQRTTAGTLIQSFGQPGDRPVPNAFIP